MRCEVYELQDVPYSTMAWVCGTLTNNLLTLMPQRLDDRIRELCAQEEIGRSLSHSSRAASYVTLVYNRDNSEKHSLRLPGWTGCTSMTHGTEPE